MNRNAPLQKTTLSGKTTSSQPPDARVDAGVPQDIGQGANVTSADQCGALCMAAPKCDRATFIPAPGGGGDGGCTTTPQPCPAHKGVTFCKSDPTSNQCSKPSHAAQAVPAVPRELGAEGPLLGELRSRIFFSPFAQQQL